MFIDTRAKRCKPYRSILGVKFGKWCPLRGSLKIRKLNEVSRTYSRSLLFVDELNQSFELCMYSEENNDMIALFRSNNKVDAEAKLHTYAKYFQA